MGAKEPSGKVRERKRPAPATASGQPAAGGSPSRDAAESADAAAGGTRRWAVCWLAAFGVLGLLQVANFAVPNRRADAAADRGELLARFQQADLPEKLGGWALVGYEFEQRERNAELGQFSNKWRFRRGAVECLVSVDYPFASWHELANCYTSSGWTLLARRDVDEALAGQAEGAYVEADLSKPTGEYGTLIFGLFNPRGEPLLPSGGRVRWLTIMDRLARSPLISRLLGRGYLGDLTTTYQVQVFVTDAVGLSPEQQDELRQFFWAVRRRVSEAEGRGER